MPVVIILAALALRFYFAATSLGFDTDIGCWTAWSGRMWEVGPLRFYSDGYFCDYPPLYMMILAIPAGLVKLFELILNTTIATNTVESPLGLVLIKLPAIAADIFIGLFLLKISKKHIGRSSGLLIMALYLLNPVTINNCATWGQVDAVLMAAIIPAIYYMYKKKMALSVAMYFIALLLKPQALMFAPVMLIGAIFNCIGFFRDLKTGKRQLIGFAVSLLSSVAVFALLSVVMKGDQDSYLWLFKKYFSTMGQYGYGTLSACNLMALLGGQWTPTTDQLFAGISYGTFGNILLVLVLLSFLVFWLLKRDNSSIFGLSIYFIAGAFCFAGMMHERYLFPVIPLLLVAYILDPDKRYLLFFAGFSVTQYINVAALLSVYVISQRYFNNGEPLMNLVAVANILMFFAFAVLLVNKQTNKKIVKVTYEQES